MGSLYCVTHRDTNRHYVGITERAVSERWREHVYRATWKAGTHFHHALVKYGREAFDWDVLHVYPTLDEAAAAEIELVAQLDLTNRTKGFNKTPGGDISPMNVPEIREKAAAALRGRSHSPEAIARMSAAKLGKKMPAFSEQARANISAAQKGKVFTPETRAKISATLKGRPRSLESRRKQSVTTTGRRKKPFSVQARANMAAARRGIKQSPETIAKRSAALKASWARRRAAANVVGSDDS